MMQTLQALAGFAAVLALMAAAAWLLRRTVRAGPASGAALALRASIGLGARERVVLVEVQGTWLVIGVAQGRVGLLHAMPRGELPAASAPQMQAHFKSILERFRR